MKKARKILISVIAVVLVIALIIGGILFWQTKNAKAVEVYPASNVTTSYWGDNTTLNGNVTTGKIQKVALKDSLIQSVNVQEGDTVQVGDVLMVYDTTSYQLTLQKDQATIALAEAKLAQANQNLVKYQNLKPSEEAPQPTERTIDHGPLELVSRLDAADLDLAENRQVFLCTGETVVEASFLNKLAETGWSVEFQLYEDDTLYGSWSVSGSDIGNRDDGDSDLPDSSGSVGEPDGEDAGVEPESVEVSASDIKDWRLGDGLTFNGDGVTFDFSKVKSYGSFTSCTPSVYEQYETVYEGGYEPDGTDNYVYSRQELADMIKSTQQEISDSQLDLRAAKLTYQQDQLVSQTGEVLASIAGTVSEVKDASTLAAGDTIITVKGSDNYTITAYVGELSLNQIAIGDTLSITAYQSGTYTTATVTEISTEPMDGDYSYYSSNPNSSWYPVTAVVDESDLDMIIDEWCEVSMTSDESSDGGLYLEKMYVRKDDKGSYIMKATEDNKLEKQYVSIGKALYGYYVEIRSGLSEDDRVAFPYGKNVKEGAPVIDADYPTY